MTIEDFFTRHNGRHPSRDPIGRTYRFSPEDMMQFAELWFEYRQKHMLGEDFVTAELLHIEAEKIEKRALTHAHVNDTHGMHENMDRARCFRIVANTITGDQAGG